jgi:hypothetical protein
MKHNKLISEFMGMDSFKDSLASLHQGKINLDVDVYEQAQYHTSWDDWLMPVVIKCFEVDEQTNDDLNFIDSIYQAVVEFIKKKK